jgi:hypothetical protein
MEILKQALKAILPEQWLDYFEVTEIKEKEKEWNITLVEKEDQIPKQLLNKKISQNGYLNPVEIHDFPIRGKPAYLKFIRRRWKEKGNKNESYFNEYEFHPKGMKATQEFGNFLKGFNREETDQLFRYR